MNDRARLGSFLKEVINWGWDEFCEAEKDTSYTSLQRTVFSLIRIASEQKLGAIKLAINRVDGKVETPVEIVYPKIYYTYPYATEIDGLPAGDVKTVEKSEQPVEKDDKKDLPSMTLRETLNEMADSDSRIVPLVLKKKKETERVVSGVDPKPDGFKSPLVKSVIAANLIDLAVEQNNFEAITEIFDQIDGKLVETLRVVGEDLYLPQYATVAPLGAVKNEKGIYQLEQASLGDAWAERLAASKKL